MSETKHKKISAYGSRDYSTYRSHSDSFLSGCFMDIQTILSENKASLTDKQQEIEKYLFDNKNVYTNKDNAFKYNFNISTAK